MIQALSTADDFVTLATETLQARDDSRLELLKQAATLLAADYDSTAAEQKRLVGKYGANSAQAAAAAERLSLLQQESAGLADSIVRASTPLPATDDQTFVVYGRILDNQGTELPGARIAANTADGTVVATTASKAQGRFELRVPVSPKRGKSKAATNEPPAATRTVQLVITAKSLQQTYTDPDALIVVAGRVCYREIPLPTAPQTG